ncbi:hypothetical protein QAD02_016643 [Eretmocerus hayati]|uniref:Uncharacterized protein n=1 Tax=Eretmocerus hayati TaxID=131215 RepID=A0ACC2PBN8_9HYME|nr:hypothetical protein QAD02_016643 [Eretmocerus hayati]
MPIPTAPPCCAADAPAHQMPSDRSNALIIRSRDAHALNHPPAVEMSILTALPHCAADVPANQLSSDRSNVHDFISELHTPHHPAAIELFSLSTRAELRESGTQWTNSLRS